MTVLSAITGQAEAQPKTLSKDFGKIVLTQAADKISTERLGFI